MSLVTDISNVIGGPLEKQGGISMQMVEAM